MKTNLDRIELVLPFKAEYVSVARLTVSGIASRMGFDFETIEDVKVALAEVCNRLVNIGSSLTNNYTIVFTVAEDILNISFNSDDKSLSCIFTEADNELGVSIINALMDNVELCTDGNSILSMSKSIEGII